MLTPRFRLTQTAKTVTIIIRAPYSSLGDLELNVEENTFVFSSKPYYLRLNLPGPIIENDFSTSSFDSDTGEFTFTLDKVNPGEHFADLDMITKLLCPKVEVSDSEGKKIVMLTHQEIDKQKSPEELNEEFGFALAGKKNFHHVSAEFTDVFEIDPREVKLKERRKLRLQYEQGKFNVDHYLCDYIENEEILEIISLTSPWSKLKRENIEFTEKELDFLKDLSNLEYHLTELQVNYCHCCLIDILYAYCYDKRTTQFEGSSESGWTIIKLAASLCWLDAFKEPQEALISAFRRSIIYPLYRNFDLSQVILTDLKELLGLGEKYIVKCLIEMYQIFLEGDCCRYIINNLFIKDYIIYIMKWDKNKFRKILTNLDDVKIEKKDLGLNLAEIEDDISVKLGNFNNLTIKDGDSDDDTDITDSEDSNTSSSDSDTSYSTN